MQVGNFFDITFDGQSTIAQASTDLPADVDNFVGNAGFVHTVTGQPLTGKILAVAPYGIPRIAGIAISPSGVWQRSTSAASVRPTARPEALSVWTKRGRPPAAGR